MKLAIAFSVLASASAFAPHQSVGYTAATSSTALSMKYKVAVVGGGPAGACAAEIFAQEKGIDTVLFERKLDNAKPCGGAIPLCMVGEFDLPESVVDRKVRERTSLIDLLLTVLLGSIIVRICVCLLTISFIFWASQWHGQHRRIDLVGRSLRTHVEVEVEEISSTYSTAILVD